MIEKLPSPISIKGIHSFLGYASFSQRFIKAFSKIANPFYKLLEKKVKFVFNEAYLKAFECLKDILIQPPLLYLPNKILPFEVTCDACGVALGAV